MTSHPTWDCGAPHLPITSKETTSMPVETPPDPTGDLLQQLAELRAIAQLASTVLRSAANQARDGQHADTELMDEVATDLDEILNRHQH